MKKIAISIAFILLLPCLSWATDDTMTEVFSNHRDNIVTLTLTCTSDSSAGTVSKAISTTNMGNIMGLYLTKLKVFNGTATPTDLYDLTITDADSIDILGGTGANMSNAAGNNVTPYTGAAYGPVPIESNLTVNISNAGNSKNVKIVMILSR